MTSVVLGAGGILGQHMYVQRPEEIYVRKTPSFLYKAIDLTQQMDLIEFLDDVKPDVVINLAGENNVDRVASDSYDDPAHCINVELPTWLGTWSAISGAHLIHVSTQGVFSGNEPPYSSTSIPRPITPYGRQKAIAERSVLFAGSTHVLIARVTFVLGIRPFNIGRTNPLESMFTLDKQPQVNDRFFSASFAKDVAADLWHLADERATGIVHLGVPERTCRYDIARMANPEARISPVGDAYFPGVSRPIDTTWALGSLHRMNIQEGIEDARRDWERYARAA